MTTMVKNKSKGVRVPPAGRWFTTAAGVEREPYTATTTTVWPPGCPGRHLYSNFLFSSPCLLDSHCRGMGKRDSISTPQHGPFSVRSLNMHASARPLLDAFSKNAYLSTAPSHLRSLNMHASARPLLDAFSKNARLSTTPSRHIL
ncbi:hypothetical protein Pcinc_030455 [Petrolisthes cinctipes]|uniref:Uncharacterized protein n=1 Tax=Petrolisthes cinctipes TaxID=88211 RepID=A0AAE1EZB7_PETCI|nr:hypothetical protein Pcinc_030455 [Petrolisthes cinctipes]